MSGVGISTSALAIGGESTAVVAITEVWNGTNWTEVLDLNTNRKQLSGAGSSNTSALAFGGETPGFTAATEEWNADGIITETVD